MSAYKVPQAGDIVQSAYSGKTATKRRICAFVGDYAILCSLDGHIAASVALADLERHWRVISHERAD